MASHQIVVLAAYLAGARLKRADTEDIAFTANKLAPGHFTWRKYKDQINIDNVRWALLDAKKSKNGGYVAGSAKQGWLLTKAGTLFAESRLGKVKAALAVHVRRDPRETAWLKAERDRLLSENAFRKFAAGQAGQIAPREVERFFRLDDYLTGVRRDDHVQRLVNAFQGDAELGPAVAAIANLLPKS